MIIREKNYIHKFNWRYFKMIDFKKLNKKDTKILSVCASILFLASIMVIANHNVSENKESSKTKIVKEKNKIDIKKVEKVDFLVHPPYEIEGYTFVGTYPTDRDLKTGNVTHVFKKK